MSTKWTGTVSGILYCFQNEGRWSYPDRVQANSGETLNDFLKPSPMIFGSVPFKAWYDEKGSAVLSRYTIQTCIPWKIVLLTGVGRLSSFCSEEDMIAADSLNWGMSLEVS